MEGLAFCNAAIASIGRRTAAGKRSCVVFDIDNTLVDTRLRTQAAAKAFARQVPGHSKLARIPLSRVGFDGAQTAKHVGYRDNTVKSFQSYWNKFFWNPNNFKLDAPLASTMDLARRAKAAGAEVFYLTGRVEGLKKGTIKQLQQLSLPDADASHVLCKPAIPSPPGSKPGSQRYLPTAPFKVGQLQRLWQRKQRVALFLSDSASDIAAVQQHTKVACVKVDFPVNHPKSKVRIRPDTPTIQVGSPQ